MKSRVRPRAILGWDHLTAELSVVDLLIVATRIISARRNVIPKRRNRPIAHSRRMWSPIVLVERGRLKFFSRNLDSIARHQYRTVKRDVRSCFPAGISANKYATMEIADHASKRCKSLVVVVELHQTVCVTKVWRNRHLALESAVLR